MGAPNRAIGWWQGHEAWCNLTAGGTMGVVYGAGSLWQWRRDRTEKHQPWCMAGDAGWRDALDFEGSRFVGVISRIFEGLAFAEMEPDLCHTYGRRGLFAYGRMLMVYLENGGDLELPFVEGVPMRYRIIDPRTGDTVSAGVRPDASLVRIAVEGGAPRIVIFHE